MADSHNSKRRTGTKRRQPSETSTRKRRTRRPLGLGEMSQKQFPFIAVINGETVVVDRIGSRITFTQWL